MSWPKAPAYTNPCGTKCFRNTINKKGIIFHFWIDANWVVIDVKPFKKLKKSVSLAQIKAEPRLQNMDLVRLGRLSVQTVKEEEWNIVMEMAEEK